MNRKPAKSPNHMTRRGFLARAGAGAAALAAPHALAWPGLRSEGDAAYDGDYDFLLAHVKFHCDIPNHDRWNRYPGGDKNVLQELARAVRCRVKIPPNCENERPKTGEEYQFNGVVTLDDLPAMRKYPYLLMVAQWRTTLKPIEQENLKAYLSAGGFLHVDDADPPDHSAAFYRSMWENLDAIFGEGSVRYLPEDHEIMHNVYDLRKIGVPIHSGPSHPPTGLVLGDRVAAFLDATDMQNAWAEINIRTGVYRGKIRHGWAEHVAMGVNIMMYAMTH